MQTGEWDQLLIRTLDDQRMSRGEKQLLQQTLAEANVDDRVKSLLWHRVFELVRDRLTDGEARKLIDWLEDVSKVLARRDEPPASCNIAEACFSPGDNCPGRIAALLDEAARKIDICVFTITDDRITSAILRALRRKVAIRIVTDDDKIVDPGSDIVRLMDAGIPVSVDRSEFHMHHKFAIFDDKKLLTGSYNWTRGAAEYNMENFVVTDDPRLITRFGTVFEGLWNKLGPYQRP